MICGMPAGFGGAKYAETFVVGTTRLGTSRIVKLAKAEQPEEESY